MTGKAATEAKKTAVVLSGGGATGAYEIGAMKALFAGKSPGTDFQPLEVDLYTGTSIGAINSSLMTARGSEPESDALKEVEDIWRRRMAKTKDSCGVFRQRGLASLFTQPAYRQHPFQILRDLIDDHAILSGHHQVRTTTFHLSPKPFESRILESINLTFMLDFSPLKELLKDEINLNDLGSSPKGLTIACTNWDDGICTLYNKEQIAEEYGRDAVLASASMPGVNEPVRIDGKLYVDGGLSLNTPLAPAIDAGANVLHVIYLNPLVETPSKQLPYTLNNSYRTFAIFMQHQIGSGTAAAGLTNRALDLIAGSEDDQIVEKIARLLDLSAEGLRGAKPVEIHRYFPTRDLTAGIGVLGWLDFDERHIDNLIKLGYEDAVSHDCEESGCLRPGA